MEKNGKNEKSLKKIIDETEITKQPEQVVYFDLLDTLQTYKGASTTGKAHYLNITAKSYDMSVEEMTKNIPVEKYLTRTAELQENGILEPVIKNGVKELINNYKAQGVRPVIISADLERGTYNATKELIEKGYIERKDVHGMISLGSKKKPKTWQKAKEKFNPNAEIVAVYEDTQENLDAAMEGLKVDGYKVNQNNYKFETEKINYKQKTGLNTNYATQNA